MEVKEEEISNNGEIKRKESNENERKSKSGSSARLNVKKECQD